MAHPFRYFRKHQKAFMAAAVVVAMFVFVIGDQITAMIGQGGGGPDPKEVAASWKGGKLTAMELDVLTQRRFFVSQFLDQLRMEGARRLIEQGGTPMLPSVPDFVLSPNSSYRDVQVGVVTTRVLADQAKKAGMSISDDVINHFLKETSFRRVSDQEMMMLMQGIRGGGNKRGLEDQLFAGLRELLLGNTYFGSFSSYTRPELAERLPVLPDNLPEQRWQDWKRINDRIALEAATIPVSDFVKDVPDPSEAELRAFYEEFKNNESHPPHQVLGAILPSADPGFKEMRKVKLNYLLGDVNAWSEKYRDTITADEIADYYERNKRTQFVKTDGSTPSFDESLFDTKPAEETVETEESPEGDVTETTVTEETTTEETTTEETPAEETTPPAEESTAPAETDPAAPADEDSSSVERSKKFQLAAFQVNEEANEAAEAADEAEVEEAAEEIVDAEEALTAEEAVEEATEALEETDAAAADEDADEDKTEYIPLDEVRDSIRNKLATDKAVVELKKVMDRIYGELQTEYNPYGFAVVTARSEKKEIPAPPAALTNLKERAKETGLTSEETVLLTQRELADTFVGKAIDVQTKSKLVIQAAFDDLQLYEPMLATDLDGNLFLVTKVEDVPEMIPAFDDVKDEVLQAWKLREASQLALKKAEEFAAEAQKKGDTLSTFFIGKPYEVTTTDLFSWLSFGTTPAEMQRGARLGDAPPLSAVGPDFMTKAFELKDDEVAALLNYDQTNAYIFRVDRRESTPEELKALFLKEANSWYGGRVMMGARWQYQQRQLIAELMDRAGLDMEKLDKFLSRSYSAE